MNNKKFFFIFSLLITGLFVFLLLNPPSFIQLLLTRLDYLAYDLRLNVLIYQSSKKLKNRPKNPIAIIDIDEKSLRTEGRWPWSRDKLAKLIQTLYQQNVAVIALDILLPESENLKDDILVKTLQTGKNKIVLGLFFSPERNISIGALPKPTIQLDQHSQKISFSEGRSYIANLPIFQQVAENGGAISTTPDQDGVIRRYSLLQRYQQNLYPALAMEAVRLYLLENNLSLQSMPMGDKTVLEAVYVGQTKISTDEQGRVFVPYLGTSKTFPYYSASDVLKHKIPAHQLENAIVFLGTSAVGLGDIRSTPVESVFPGVEIHANVAEGLLTQRFPYVVSWIIGVELCLLIVTGLFLGAIFSFTGPLLATMTSLIFLALIFFGSLVLWEFQQIVFPISLWMLQVIALVSFKMIYGFSIESRRRDELKKVFEQYVPAGHVAALIQHPQSIDVFEGQRKTMSVLFMDIRNFTTITEKLDIIKLKKLLNFFLTHMTKTIFNHGGTVDKYVGDMIMAFWGAPLNDPQHAQHAVSAGLHMVALTDSLQTELLIMNLPSIRIGIGINTGIMDVGDMGSAYRRAYTVLGDAVNLASRLESLTKYYGVNIICGEQTAHENKHIFVFCLLDKIRVKGKQIGVVIYQPIGLISTITEEKQAEIYQHEQALVAYFAQDFQLAQQLFFSLHQRYPETVLYQIYLSRIQAFIQYPPDKNWDGIFEHHEK